MAAYGRREPEWSLMQAEFIAGAVATATLRSAMSVGWGGVEEAFGT